MASQPTLSGVGNAVSWTELRDMAHVLADTVIEEQRRWRKGQATEITNQFRVLLALAAYILFQDLRRRAANTSCADAQVTTLRERLLKLAVWVERSVRLLVLHFRLTFPWLSTWRELARAVGPKT